MRTSIKFDFEEDENEQAKMIMFAQDMYYALDGIKGKIRNRLKHGEIQPEEEVFLESLLDALFVSGIDL